MLLEELEAASLARQEMLVRNTRRFLSPDLAKLLLERSHSFRYGDPHQMLWAARLAVVIAERLISEDPAEERRHSDLCATCYFQLSNALRALGDLAGAESATHSAQEFLQHGAGSLIARALVYEGLGSLRTAQLRYHEAVHHYAAAVELLRDTGRAELVGRALVGQAIAAGESGAPEDALELLFEAIPKVEVDTRLTLAACHAVVRFLIDCGRIDEAACRWIELRSLYTKLDEPILRIKASWLEGLLLKAQGRYQAALKMLEDARSGLRERRLGYDGALVALDMADCYFRLGRTQELRQALSEVMTLICEHNVDRQALVTMIALREAAAMRPSEDR
jgi:tetratricopeptide (TPR) repeat protein